MKSHTTTTLIFAAIVNVDRILEGDAPDPELAPGDLIFIGSRDV